MGAPSVGFGGKPKNIQANAQNAFQSKSLAGERSSGSEKSLPAIVFAVAATTSDLVSEPSALIRLGSVSDSSWLALVRFQVCKF